jgi:hypothetical protein
LFNDFNISSIVAKNEVVEDKVVEDKIVEVVEFDDKVFIDTVDFILT